MKVGDIISYDTRMLTGRERDRGKVKYGIVIERPNGVEFVNWRAGHSCGGRGKEGHCWYCLEDFAKIIEEA